MQTNLFDLKREFLEYCELDKGQSSLTIAGYERYLDKPPESFGATLSDLFRGAFGKGGVKLVYEEQNDAAVDILVIRQRAEGNTGYATAQPAADAIVSASLALAKKLLKGNIPPPVRR